jgi:hypothetical protein
MDRGVVDAPSRQKIDIGFVDQLVRLDVKFLHEFARLANADFSKLIITQVERLLGTVRIRATIVNELAGVAGKCPKL